MADLTTKIKLYASSLGVTSVDFSTKVLLQDDGSGAYIREWNLEITQPTIEQLNTFESQANTYEQNLITTKADNLSSAKTKLAGLGLSINEIKEAFNIWVT